MGVDSIEMAVEHLRLQVFSQIGVFVHIGSIPHGEEGAPHEVVVAHGVVGLHAHIAGGGADHHIIGAGEVAVAVDAALHVDPVVSVALRSVGVRTVPRTHKG